MDLYTKVAYDTSKHLTLSYSSSFGISSRFFATSLKPHVYAIYGLVRIADEIVVTYHGPEARNWL
jgi:phytoene synthase